MTGSPADLSGSGEQPEAQSAAQRLAYLKARVRLYFAALGRLRVAEQGLVAKATRQGLEHRAHRLRQAAEDVARHERELHELAKEDA